MNQKESLLKNRVRSIAHAFKGFFILLRSESSIQIQFVLAIIVTIAGFYYKISPTEWIIQVLAIGLVMGLEGLNTAIEQLSDFVHPDYNKSIGRLKDIAAGAVFIGAASAVIVGLIIYWPKVF